jgi:hypothetical protein
MIQLLLTSPFWEDPATLSTDGEDEEAVLAICVTALREAGYDIQIRDESGELVQYEGDTDA